jgi:hypothetical protein
VTTVTQLIDSCSSLLHSHTGVTEMSTFLTSSVTSTADQIEVAHPTRVNQGVIEVGDELMLVSDQGSAGVVTLFPGQRGFMATVPAAHPVNSRVINDPLIPRYRLFEEICATIRQLDDLYQVKTTEITASAVANTYEIPVDVVRILKVQYQTIGPSLEWMSVNSFTEDYNADFTSGKAVTLHANGCIFPGRRIQITYQASLGVPAATSDTLETLGIPPELHDVIRYGACWRAIKTLAPSRMNQRAVETPETNGVSPNSISAVAKELFQLFAFRRDEERKRLVTMYPKRKHYVR